MKVLFPWADLRRSRIQIILTDADKYIQATLSYVHYKVGAVVLRNL